MPPAGRFPRDSPARPSTARRSGADGPPLGEIGIAGISRARIAWLAGVLLLGWLAFAFVAQAGDPAHAAERAATVTRDNAALSLEVAALKAEVTLVEEPHWVLQQARTYGLQTTTEVPFVLAPDAPALAPDAPGSAARRLGTEQVKVSPLDRWLEILFGASR